MGLKRLLAIICVICALIPLTVGVASATTWTAMVPDCDEYVTLRSKPDTGSKAICQIMYANVLMASEYNSKFMYCCYDGKYGYVLKSYLVPATGIWEYRFQVVNCNSYVTLRAMPDKNSKELARIPKGTVLEYVDCCDVTESQFAYVYYNGQYGFVLFDYLDCLNPQ